MNMHALMDYLIVHVSSRAEPTLHTITGLLKELKEDLLRALTVLSLQLHLVLHHLAHNLLLEILACLLLVSDHVGETVHLIVEALQDGLLTIQAVFALLVHTVGDADDLISDLLLVTFLGFLAEFLLTGQVEAEGEGSLVHLLHDLGLEVLARSLFLGEVQRDGGLHSLDLLGLALIHHFTREALGSELLVESRNLLVKWLELLLLGDLGTEELVVEHLQLELHGVTTSLLLVL